jgi:hypothetical protein
VTHKEHDALVNALAAEILEAFKDRDNEDAQVISLAVALWQAAGDPSTDAVMGASLSEALTEAGLDEFATRVAALVESRIWPQE